MSWENIKRRTGIQLCYPFEEKRLEKWEPPYITQPKLDGVRCRALRLRGTWILFSSTEEIILSVPHIIESLESMDIPSDVNELDGELYRHGWSFEEVNSVCSRTVNIHPEHGKIKFYVFDIVEDVTDQASRLLKLGDIAFNDIIIRVAHKICWSFKEVMTAYRQYLDDGYEGIIIRHFLASYVRKRSIYVMKFKPKKSDIYQISGWKEEVDKYGLPKNRMGALEFTKDGQSFSAGSGMTDNDREYLWSIRDSLIGKYAKLEYQHTTPGRGVPRFPIYVSIVEESDDF